MATTPRYTSRDLECMPDVEGVRYEIIDGDLYVSKQPHAEHQDACGNVYFAVQSWNLQSRAGRTLFAPGLIFSPEQDVAPDVVWISNARYAEGLDEAGHLQVAPELVVEVLSYGATNERRDREMKLSLYSRQGVIEYWIVDRRRRRVQIYRREKAALGLVATLEDDDVLTSPLLPGFASPVSAFWGT